MPPGHLAPVCSPAPLEMVTRLSCCMDAVCLLNTVEPWSPGTGPKMWPLCGSMCSRLAYTRTRTSLTANRPHSLNLHHHDAMQHAGACFIEQCPLCTLVWTHGRAMVVAHVLATSRERRRRGQTLQLHGSLRTSGMPGKVRII